MNRGPRNPPGDPHPSPRGLPRKVEFDCIYTSEADLGGYTCASKFPPWGRTSCFDVSGACRGPVLGQSVMLRTCRGPVWSLFLESIGKKFPEFLLQILLWEEF